MKISMKVIDDRTSTRLKSVCEEKENFSVQINWGEVPRYMPLRDNAVLIEENLK